MMTESDPRKGRLNARKHGVQFADAVVVLDDENALTLRDPSEHEEDRWVTLGLGALGRIPVISARKATASERRRYKESHEA